MQNLQHGELKLLTTFMSLCEKSYNILYRRNYSGLSAAWIPGWPREFLAKYNSVFPIEIILTAHHHDHYIMLSALFSL